MRFQLLLLGTALATFGYSCALLERPSSPAAPAPASAAARILGEPVAPVASVANSYLSAPAAPVDARVARTMTALSALEMHVVAKSHPEALQKAFQAYYSYKAAHPEQVKKPYLYYVDYGLDNRTGRGYVFDMDKLELVDGPFMVAHGRGSSRARDAVPSRFTNRNGSATTSLGLYLTQETYNFSGTSGGRRYTSIGLRLKGLSGRFNSAARARGIVVHGAPYVTETQAGRSEGCPAMDQDRARRLIPMLAGGSIVFHYSPNDEEWVRNDPWTSLLGEVKAE